MDLEEDIEMLKRTILSKAFKGDLATNIIYEENSEKETSFNL